MGAQGLDFQTVDVRFENQGLDTKTQQKLVVPGKWLQLENVSLAPDYTPRRRDGHQKLVADANGNALMTHGEELLVINETAVSTVSTTNPGTGTAVNKVATVTGSFANVLIGKESIVQEQGKRDSLDCANGDGLTCYVWRELTSAAVVVSVKYCVVDENTGARVAIGTARTSANILCPRVVYSFGAFFIFYIDTGLNIIECRCLETSTLFISGGATIVVSANLNLINFDACDFGDPGPVRSISSVMLTYGWKDGTTSLRTLQVIRTGIIPSVGLGPTNLVTQAQGQQATMTGIACCAYTSLTPGALPDFAAGLTLAGAGTLAGTIGTVIDVTWTVTTAATQLDTTLRPTPANHICACAYGFNLAVFSDGASFFNAATGGVTPIRLLQVDNGLTPMAGPVSLINSAYFDQGATRASGPQGPFIHGKPFVSVNSKAIPQLLLPVSIMEDYYNLNAATVSSNAQNGFYLLDCTDAGFPFVAARALYQSMACPEAAPLLTLLGPTISTPCSTISIGPSTQLGSDRVFGTAALEVVTLTLITSGAATGAPITASDNGICQLKMTPVYQHGSPRGELGTTAFAADGVLNSYDGALMAEHGFLMYPEGINVTRTGGGGLMTAGTHLFCAIYEWTDNQGLRHQSAPSPIVSVTNTALDQVSVTIPTLLLTQKTNIQLVVFMSQAGGLTLNRLTSILTPFLNTPNANSVVTGDISLPDANVIGNELLYTQPTQPGTTLANISPAPMTALTVAQNRLFFDISDQPNSFGYSQQFIPGVGLQFSDTLSGQLPLVAGKRVGFSPMDEKVIILCERKLFVIYGTGPTPSGGFNNYSDPQEIPSDVGCCEPLSILRIPDGVVFKSAKGWYFLDRALTVQYIGDGPANLDNSTNISFITPSPVYSAVMLENEQECRFTTLDEQTGITSTQLRFDYQKKQWSTAVQSVGSYLMADAIWWQSIRRYVSVSQADGLNQDVPGSRYDQPGNQAPRPITTTLRTAWLHLSKLSGFQRVRRLYLSGSVPFGSVPNTTLVIDVDFDENFGLLGLNRAPGAYTVTVPLGTIVFGTGMPIDLGHKLSRQKCKAVAFTFTETMSTVEQVPLTGLQDLMLELGMKRGTNKLKPAQVVT